VLRADRGGPLRPSPEAGQSFGNYPEQSMAHNISPVLFGFHRLVRLSVRGFQAVV
jgi:hypothetical protein